MTHNLDRRITISRPGTQTGTDAFGHPVYGPPVEFSVWAARRDVSDSEKATAGTISSSLMTRFVVRSSSQTRGIKPSHGLTHEGAAYNIMGVKETADGRRRFLEITCVRSAD